jgi:hypothetical protein
VKTLVAHTPRIQVQRACYILNTSINENDSQMQIANVTKIVPLQLMSRNTSRNIHALFQLKMAQKAHGYCIASLEKALKSHQY